jgi:hypothetical protein
MSKNSYKNTNSESSSSIWNHIRMTIISLGYIAMKATLESIERQMAEKQKQRD